MKRYKPSATAGNILFSKRTHQTFDPTLTTATLLSLSSLSIKAINKKRSSVPTVFVAIVALVWTVTIVASSMVTAFVPNMRHFTPRNSRFGNKVVLLEPASSRRNIYFDCTNKHHVQQQPTIRFPLYATKNNNIHTVLNTSEINKNKLLTIPTTTTTTTKTKNNIDDNVSNDNNKIINLSTVQYTELESVLVDGWKYPKYRVDQVWDWIRSKGITDPNKMLNIPSTLREQLITYTKPSSLELVLELVSKKDGTIKRVYKCYDGQMIESVLMPYSIDGRYTACISSQAGCAQGCVFCATGQMGFSRQLTSDEIYEQVSRFASELQQQQHYTSSSSTQTQQAQQQQQKFVDEDVSSKSKRTSIHKNKQQSISPPPPQQQQHGRTIRLSNVVFMGMGEPLANYKNVATAINRITNDLGISARKITVSTVGIVPNIRKLTSDPNIPPIRLAVSLHCSTDTERTKLLPTNKRYGGLVPLLDAINEYIQVTGRRVTFEWALIDGTNDTPEIARQLGNLLTKGGNPHLEPKNTVYPRLRRDMIHINVIPLNPTSLYKNGKPTQRANVNTFIDILQNEYGIACTPRVRRGIDIEAGCGQLKAQVLVKEEKQQQQNGKEEEDDDASSTIYQENQLSFSEFLPKKDALAAAAGTMPIVGVYDDDDDEDEDNDDNDRDVSYDGVHNDDDDDVTTTVGATTTVTTTIAAGTTTTTTSLSQPPTNTNVIVIRGNNNNNNKVDDDNDEAPITYTIAADAVDFDAVADEDYVEDDIDIDEAKRLLDLVKGTTIQTSISVVSSSTPSTPSNKMTSTDKEHNSSSKRTKKYKRHQKQNF